MIKNSRPGRWTAHPRQNLRSSYAAASKVVAISNVAPLKKDRVADCRHWQYGVDLSSPVGAVTCHKLLLRAEARQIQLRGNDREASCWADLRAHSIMASPPRRCTTPSGSIARWDWMRFKQSSNGDLVTNPIRAAHPTGPRCTPARQWTKTLFPSRRVAKAMDFTSRQASSRSRPA